VGVTGIVVNTGLLYILTEYMHLFYLISSFFAIEASIINNFIWNDVWTFKTKKNKPLINRFFSYQIITTSGLVGNIILLSMFTDIYHIYYIFSNLMAIPIITAWNFIANRYTTWK
jgi:dolichol-phosphate mannosyltransferase